MAQDAAPAIPSPPAGPVSRPGSARVDLRRVHELVGRAARRIRTQGALEGLTTASIAASATALASVVAVRFEVVDPVAGTALLAAAGGVVGLGALIGGLRRLDREEVARRVDRASGLADRLSTAIAFERLAGEPGQDDDTHALMRAAMRDAVRALPRARVEAATPYRAPRDLKPALGFAVVAALVAGLGVPVPDRDPRVIAATPDAAKRGATVVIGGERLCGAHAQPAASCEPVGAMVTVGGDGELAAAGAPGTLGGSLLLMAALPAATGPVPASITSWQGGAITIIVPGNARTGPTQLVVWARGKKIGAVPFEVLDDQDPRNFSANTVSLDTDDQAYMRELVADLKAAAQRDNAQELSDYAAKIEQLLDMADNGELTKEELLAQMKQAEDELAKGAEPDQADIDKALAQSGKELQKNELTKELGKALEKNDIEQAQKEMEKLADKLDKGELSDQQTEQLAKTLEQTAEQFAKKQDQQDAKTHNDIQKTQDAIRRLEKQRDQAKNDQERQDTERRLDKKKRELEQLKKKEEQREQSAQRRSLKRLHKDMEETAKQLQKKPQPGQDQQENQRQASRSLKDMADETGKVDADQRKRAAQKKVASQMDDLREAMRRAKQRGQNGPKNPFGKNGKNRDFGRRAAGGRGQKGAWKPGQGQGPGQGKQPGQGQQNGGQGNQPPSGPSETWGDGHDPNLVGDSTAKSGNTQDQDVSGVHGKHGPSRRETILAAAQKGFASTAYKDVYADYKKIVEEVMRSEKVPSSYKYYVKKYFTKIKPHAMD